MKGLPEHQEQLPELQKQPEEPKPKDECWRTVKPGIQQNDKGQLQTNLPLPSRSWGRP